MKPIRMVHDMTDKYMSVTVEFGHVEYDDEGNGVVFDDHTETFDVSDQTAPFTDLFDDIAFEIRNSLE